MAQKPAPPNSMNHNMAKSAYTVRSQNVWRGITHWLFILLALTLGFGQLLRVEIMGVPLYLHDVVVAIIGVINISTIRRTFLSLPGITFILLGLGIGWIVALFRFPVLNLMIPILYTLRFLAYLTLYCIAVSRKYKLPLIYLYIAGITTAVIGIGQYVIMPDLRWAKFLGWDDHLYRLVMPHYDPTFTGVMLTLGLILSVIHNKWKGSLIFAVAILLTYSRSVWLSLIITGIMCIKNKKMIFIATTLFLISLLLLPQRFGEGNNLLRTFSIESRYEHDQNLLKAVGGYSITGIGMNTLSLIMSDTSQYSEHASGTNNSYLFMLLTTGVIGLIGLVIFLNSLYRDSRYQPVIVFVLVASLFNNVLFYPFVFIWLILADITVPNES